MLGATSVFAELQSALDRIWRVSAPSTAQGPIGLIRSRVLSFGMVLAMGFLLLVSLVLGAVLSAVGTFTWVFAHSHGSRKEERPMAHSA